MLNPGGPNLFLRSEYSWFLIALSICWASTTGGFESWPHLVVIQSSLPGFPTWTQMLMARKHKCTTGVERWDKQWQRHMREYWERLIIFVFFKKNWWISKNLYVWGENWVKLIRIRVMMFGWKHLGLFLKYFYFICALKHYYNEHILLV